MIVNVQDDFMVDVEFFGLDSFIEMFVKKRIPIMFVQQYLKNSINNV